MSKKKNEENKLLKAERKRIKAELRAKAKESKKQESSKTGSLESRIAAADKSAKTRRAAQKKARRKAKDVYNFLGWKKMYQDGICLVEDGIYSETVTFTDVSYQSARSDRQDMIFNTLCALTNFFGPDVHVQFSIINSPVPEAEIGRRTFVDVPEDNPFHVYGETYNKILNDKMREGVSNIRRGLYISYSVEETDMNRAVQSLSNVRTQILSSMASIGSKARKLDGQERLELIWELLHPGDESHFDLARDILDGGGLLTDKDLVAPMAIDFKPQSQDLMNGLLHPDANFTIDGEKWGQVLAIQSFGAELTDDAIASIVDLPIPMCMTWHIHGWSKSDSVAKVRNACSLVDLEIMQEQNRNAKRHVDIDLLPPSLRHHKGDIEALLHQVLNNNQRIYEYTGLVYVHAKDVDKLADAAMQVICTARQSSLTIKKLPYCQREGLNSILPLAHNHVGMKRTLTTAQVAIMVPFATQELNDDGGIYLGQNNRSGNLVIENRKLLGSPMGFIFGVTGYGKSFFAKLEITGAIMASARGGCLTTCPNCRKPLSGQSEVCPYCAEPLFTDQIIILDPAGEYANIAQQGGIHHDMSPDTTTFLNIFDRSDVSDKGAQSQLAFKQDAILAMTAAAMGEGSEGLPESEKSIIARVVELAYRLSQARGQDPTLGEFYSILLEQPEPEARDIALRYERYVMGAMSFFNHPSNIKLDRRIVDISFRDLPETSRAFGMIAVLEAIRNRMYYNHARGITTWLYVDEVQSMFSHPAIINYFSRFWAEGRKFGLIGTGMTQNAEKMLGYEEARAMIGNSDHIMLLKQAPTDRARWAELLGLSEHEQTCIGESAKAGDGLLISGGARIPIRGEFPKGNALYELFSTKASEIAERNRNARFDAAKSAKENAVAETMQETPVARPQQTEMYDGWATPIATVLSVVEHGDAWSARLASHGIIRVADLRGKARSELLEIDGIGPAAVRALETTLACCGFGKVVR